MNRDKELMEMIQDELLVLLDSTPNEVFCSDKGRDAFATKMCQIVVDNFKEE